MGKVTVRGEAARLEAINIVKNGGTLEDAAKTTGFGADYVRQLCNSRGIEWKNHTKQSRFNEIVRLANEGHTAKEIAEELAISYALVSSRLREAGVKAVKKVKRPFKLDHEAVRMYYSEGHTARETAAHFGSSKDYVRQICKGIRTGNQYTDGQFDREANAIRYIEERTPWFEYAGDFTGVDGYVNLKCKKCGAIIRKSFVTVRHGCAECTECKKAEAQQKADKRKREKEAEADYKRWFKLSNLKAEQIGMQTCEGCGAMFVAERRGAKYCSTKCMTKTNNTRKVDRRRRRVLEVYDDDITVEATYEKDGGRCWICGCRCDWDDYVIDDNGYFIAGDSYPSRDHVVPLAKGGRHSWDNVRLACRRCNTLKSDKIISPCPQK